MVSKRREGSEPASLNEVLAKYWELANLAPETTKGSITGQLKALDALCAELTALAGEPKAAPRVSAVYRAAWMPEPGREN